MAIRYYETFLAVNCAGDYTGVRMYFYGDPSEANPYRNAKNIVNGFTAPSVGASVASKVEAILADDCFIQSFRARQVSAATGSTSAKVYPPADHPGTFGGTVEANQVAAVSVWLTEQESSINGRNFWPGVSEDALVGGRFTNDYKTAFGAMMQSLLDGIVTSGATWRLAVKFRSPLNFVAIQNGYISPTPGTMRKRLQPW